MKRKYKYFKKIVTICFLITLVSCDLEVQKQFDFKPEIVPIDDVYKNVTVWEFLQTQTTPSTYMEPANVNTSLDLFKFDLLIDAIKITGLEAEYSSTDPNRTYVLLNNEAFLGAISTTTTVPAGITTIFGVFKSLAPKNSTLSSLVNTPALVDKLRNILKAHIVTSYITQLPTLYVAQKDYVYNTLGPSPNNVIYFKRDERLVILINSSAKVPLGTTTLGKTTTVTQHNFVFKYGIGHISNGYTRIAPF